TRTGSSVSSADYHNKGVMCCATNEEGQECTQLYDYDLDRDPEKNEEDFNVTVSSKQSLLLRCRSRNPKPVWKKDNETLDARKLACSSKDNKELCIKSDRHLSTRMAYVFIRSVSEEHRGMYTCTGGGKIAKAVDVRIQDNASLDAQLNKSKIIPAQKASSTCLQASVSYHPVLHYCSWETPDNMRIKCTRETFVTKHRTVRLCPQNPSHPSLITGDYKLHLMAGNQYLTKTITVKVV
uniref:receptor-type tyrosine-protein kinase FLT3-like n=1 Tax=Monopterus albus TaxID=43700 RepID=UPI0009B44FC5